MLRDDFAGQNGFVWFTGVVANNQDKAQVGRVRVRIIGWHNENVNLQPDEELPWAQILLPANNSKSFSSPKPGEWVMGFFQDGQNGQQPVIVGVYPRIVSQKVRTATSDAQSLSALEAQLVQEKAILADLIKNTTAATVRNQSVPQQEKKIAELEKQISILKSKPVSPWVDRRTQAEINSGPNPPAGVVGYVQDEPTFPRLARSVMEGTIVDKNNKDLAHVCDFISEMQKNINLKKYTKALANELREIIRKVLKALGFSDATGQYSWILNTLKSYARELKRIQKEIIQPIIDFQKYVLAYITKIRAMIQWLISLPERFLKMLDECYQRLLKLIRQILVDTVKGFGEGFTDGVDSQDYLPIVGAALDAVDETFNTLDLAKNTIAGAQIIVDSATIGILIPVSADEVAAANTYINSYTTSGNNFVSSVTAGLQAP